MALRKMLPLPLPLLRALLLVDLPAHLLTLLVAQGLTRGGFRGGLHNTVLFAGIRCELGPTPVTTSSLGRTLDLVALYERTCADQYTTRALLKLSGSLRESARARGMKSIQGAAARCCSVGLRDGIRSDTELIVRIHFGGPRVGQ